MHQSIQQMTEWAAYKYKPNIYKDLGTIAANDDTIIFHLNHPVSDGIYIAGLCRHIGNKPIKSKISSVHLMKNLLKKLKND